MGLFGKPKIEDLPKFDEKAAQEATASQPVSKEVELISAIKDEFSITISGILRQSQKKLQATNDELGKVESQLHNVKIYQISLRKKAEILESKILYMRGGSPETAEQDLAEEEQNVLMYIKSVTNHLTSVIIELRDLRRLLSKVSVVPTDPSMPPLESGREFGAKVVELVHKVQLDLAAMTDNFVGVYDLEAEVVRVASEHGITFPNYGQAQAPQGVQQPVGNPQQTQQIPPQQAQPPQ